MIYWRQLASGIYQTQENGKTLTVQLQGVWRIIINGQKRLEQYEDKESAQLAAVRMAYLI